MLFKKHGQMSMAHGSVKKASRRTIGVGRSTAGAYGQLASGVSPVLTCTGGIGKNRAPTTKSGFLQEEGRENVTSYFVQFDIM